MRDPSAWIACGEGGEEAAGAAAAAGRARGGAGPESLEAAEPYTKLLCSELGPADVMVGSDMLSSLLLLTTHYSLLTAHY